MESDEELEKLLFELASQSRLRILRELRAEKLKMQEVARRLGVTGTEAFRQLERLSAASLVQRQPDGAYAIAEYGRLVLQLTSSFEFISRYKEYFSTHDVMRLPSQFLHRLGELSGTELVTDTIEALNRGERAFMEAEQYGWGIAEGTIPGSMGPIMDAKLRKGLKLRMLIPENRLIANVSQLREAKNIEVRGLTDLPVIVMITEKEAGICFRQAGGKVDYAGFYGRDQTFLNWVKDLFLYYWEVGKQF